MYVSEYWVHIVKVRGNRLHNIHPFYQLLFWENQNEYEWYEYSTVEPLIGTVRILCEVKPSYSAYTEYKPDVCESVESEYEIVYDVHIL